jgi:outer membrane lipase/esterase
MKATDRALARIGMAALPLLLAATPAAAQQKYSNLFVFGDSLVDAGNAQEARRLGGGIDPASAGAGYFQGRFSNGDNFADYLSISISGNRSQASLLGGTNFSVGGAQFREVTGDASPSFAEQIGAFSASGKTFDANSLVLLTFGGNDVRSELTRYGGFLAAGRPQDFVPDFTATLNALAAGLDTLYASGARNFIVTGLPNIGQIPNVTLRGIPPLNAKGEELSRRLNAGYTTPDIGDDDERDIADVVSSFAGRSGADAQFFDLFDYQRRLNAAPQDFGLPANLNQRDICLTTSANAPECTGFVYFDDVHPTTQLHRAIANGLTTQLGIAAVPEPASWLLMIAGFGLVASTVRRRRYALRVVYA